MWQNRRTEGSLEKGSNREVFSPQVNMGSVSTGECTQGRTALGAEV